MMRIKETKALILSLCLILGVVQYSSGQNASDVLRYSFITSNGTARYVSMGGAFSALGADFSSLSFNPAGLGIYRSSEFTITPSFKNKVIDSEYVGNTFSDSRTRFAFENIGFVTSFSNQKSEENGLVMVNLGVGYNRLADFNSESVAYGSNTANSIMDYFALRANGYNHLNITETDDYNPYTSTSAPWDAILAWNTFLLDTFPGETSSYYAALNQGEGVDQEQTISSQGSMGEFLIALASNFSNKFYLGATIGIQNIFYSQTVIHKETAFSTNTPIPNGNKFNSLQYKQTLDVDGTGLNFKIGAIYKPIDFLRFGVALHTPTYFSMNEVYRAYMNTSMLNGTWTGTSPRNMNRYAIESPYKMIGSLAFTLEDKGLLSMEVEYLDYTTMRLGNGGDGNTFTSENQQIKNEFTNTFNIKAGGEVWISNFALRAGYALYGSPYASGTLNSGKSISVISGGLGYRVGNTFFDFAYQRLMGEDSYYMYNLKNIDGSSAINAVNREIQQGKVLLTVGFKF